MKGKFIVVEGIDGAGKSTHLQFLCARIEALKKVRVLLTREPGGTPLAEEIRSLLLKTPMDGLTETLLAFAARQDHVRSVILPALDEGVWVVCDRFTDSTRAYQGGGAGVPSDLIENLAKTVPEGASPDRVYVFDAPSSLAAERRAARAEPSDRFEAEDEAYFERVRHVYLDRARDLPAIYRVLDSSLALEKIQKELEKDISTL